MSTHGHSQAAHAELEDSGALASREALVLRCVQRHGPMTDRQVMQQLGFADPNAVRPRITALIQRGQLSEVGSTLDPITRKTVRLVGATGRAVQMTLPI